VNQNVPEPGQWCQVTSKRGWQDAQLAHAQDGIIVVHGFASALQRDDAMADVNAALGRDLEIPFYDVT
jgi:hypothetical protein